MDGVLSRLKNLDAYPKVNEDFFQRTLSGGIITIASSILMLCLFISEFSAHPTPDGCLDQLCCSTKRGHEGFSMLHIITVPILDKLTWRRPLHEDHHFE